MVLKRIMNKKNKRADGGKETDHQTADTAEREKIEQLLAELLPELNLRLFLETEVSTRLLWVEAVTVTAYQGAPLKEQPGKPGFIRRWKRLTGMLARPRSFKKYIKERR